MVKISVKKITKTLMVNLWKKVLVKFVTKTLTENKKVRKCSLL